VKSGLRFTIFQILRISLRKPVLPQARAGPTQSCRELEQLGVLTRASAIVKTVP